MADKPEITRTVHRKRINAPDGSWIELDVLEKLRSIHGKGFQYQEEHFHFDERKPDVKRRQVIKNIYNPNDPTQWIEVPVWTNVAVTGLSKFQWKGYGLNFDNTAANEERRVHTVTVPRGGDIGAGGTLTTEAVVRTHSGQESKFHWQGDYQRFQNQAEEDPDPYTGDTGMPNIKRNSENDFEVDGGGSPRFAGDEGA